MTRLKANIKVAVVVSRFNETYTRSLLCCATDTLKKNGVGKRNIDVRWVPGAYELPYAANELARSKRYDAVLCLGCVIKGQTSHDFHVASWAATGTGLVSLLTRVPVLFGVLTPHSDAQARKRSRPGPLNRGREIAEAAIEMINFRRSR